MEKELEDEVEQELENEALPTEQIVQVSDTTMMN
ncbi:MAG: hypothetical protein JWQ09_650, partial [Segetibacter sp.]|nr:hypothetical protein [Segetibacter sp.]